MLWRAPAALAADMPVTAAANTHRAISANLLLARRALFATWYVAFKEKQPVPPMAAFLAKWHKLRIQVAEAASRLEGKANDRWSLLRAVPKD